MEVHQPIGTSTSESAPNNDTSTSIAPGHAPGGTDARDNGNVGKRKIPRKIAGGARLASRAGGGIQGDGDSDNEDEDEDEAVDDEDEGNEGDEEDGEEDEDEYEDEDPSECIAASVKNTLQEIEEELGITNGLLRNNVDILYCDATFEDTDEPRTVETLSRVNSPISNKYVDVHLFYHCRSGYYDVEWFYTIGFKISRHATPRSKTPVSHTATLRALRDRPVDHRYGTPGWRSIAYALYDDEDNSGRDWRRVEIFSVDIDMGGLVAVHEALWGPLAELPPDASEENQIERRETLIRGLRVLLAAVGIEYYISCRDDEDDATPSQYTNDPGQIVWMLEGGGDRWLARGVREACGFQLARDPEEERKGREEREEVARGGSDDEDDEECDSADDDYGF